MACRAVNDSAWRSRVRSRRIRPSCCSMSRSARSTRSRGSSSRMPSARCGSASLSPRCSSPTMCVRRSRSATASRCCDRAGSSRSVPPSELTGPAGDAIRGRAPGAGLGMSAWDHRKTRSAAARVATLVAVVATSRRGGQAIHRRRRRRPYAPAPAGGLRRRISGPRGHDRPIVVASKPFAESYILAEMFAQLLEAHGRRVERRLGLGGTEIAYAALRRDAIDVYPEYTGTGLVVVLGLHPRYDPTTVFATVARESRAARQHPLASAAWLREHIRHRSAAPTSGFAASGNAERSGARGAALRAGLTADFIGRPDGLPGLTAAYGIHFRGVRALAPGGQVPGARRRRRGRHRRVFDRRPHCAIRSRRAA